MKTTVRKKGKGYRLDLFSDDGRLIAQSDYPTKAKADAMAETLKATNTERTAGTPPADA